LRHHAPSKWPDTAEIRDGTAFLALGSMNKQYVKILVATHRVDIGHGAQGDI
jgi:hypothetical protein